MLSMACMHARLCFRERELARMERELLSPNKEGDEGQADDADSAHQIPEADVPVRAETIG
jgi:hypothetical protein